MPQQANDRRVATGITPRAVLGMWLSRMGPCCLGVLLKTGGCCQQGERIKTCTDYQAVHYSGQAGQRRMDLGGGEALPPDGSSPLRHGGWSWLWRRRRLFGTSVAFRIRAARVVGCITCAI